MKLQYIMTVFPDNRETAATGEAVFTEDPGIENEVINLYPQIMYQTFEGFGGAFTDSAGYVYSLMDESQKAELIDSYFGADRMNYTLGRMHLDSCDFSLAPYEAMSDPQDPQMKSFSLHRTEQYIVPFIRDAERRSGRKIDLMISPWSPPAFMKTNAKRSQGGKLKPEYRKLWAAYICRYIAQLREEGLHVCRMSVQNEPNAVQTWDSCLYTAREEKEFLRDDLYPALQKAGLDDMEILIWDHNKERAYERACEIIDKDTDSMIAGIAFHWYSGDHFETLDLIRRRFPEKKLILSEACIEYYKCSKGDSLTIAQKYAHEMIGNMNAGMNAFYDWNLVLNEEGGPNHVGNFCEAPYLYDVHKHELTERSTLSYIRHFSKYIRPGAVRIAFSRYTTDLEVTAFQNPDGSLAAVILNRTDKPRRFVIRLNGMAASLSIEARAIMTVCCEAPGVR